MTKYQERLTKEQEKIAKESSFFYDFLTDKIIDYLYVKQNKISPGAMVQTLQHLLADFIEFFVRTNDLNDKETDSFLKDSDIFLAEFTKYLIKRNKTLKKQDFKDKYDLH